jgi:DNA-directed RNA polymerase subunit H (RpoH/RPB5)
MLLYRIMQNVTEILTRFRGLHPSPMCEAQPHLSSCDAFVEHFGEEPDRALLTMRFVHPTRADVNFLVLFAAHDDASKNIGKQGIVGYVWQFKELGATGGILVVESSKSKRPITSMAVDVLQTADIPIEIFEDTQLVFNVFMHDFQPQYEVVDPSKYGEITSTFCALSQLPRMKTSDIIARLLGVRRGTVVKMTSILETSGVCVNYLYVQ